MFLPASPAVRPITATLVRQIAGMGGDVSGLRAGAGRGPPEEEIRRAKPCAHRNRTQEISMIRMLAVAVRARLSRSPRVRAAEAAGRRSIRRTRSISTPTTAASSSSCAPISRPSTPSASSSSRASGYYDNVPFHRVIAGFMAQTGDGQNGDGTGGSKYPNLQAEFSNVPFKRGIVGMARARRPEFRQLASSSSCLARRRASTASTP